MAKHFVSKEVFENEMSRINKLMCDEIIKNNGKCHGFITYGINSNNSLVSDLINIARMDDPEDWLEDFNNMKEMNGYKIKNDWSNEPIFDGDIYATEKATELKIINGWYNFRNYENKFKGLTNEQIKALDDINYDYGLVASTEYNNKLLEKLGFTKEQLQVVFCSKIYELIDLPNYAELEFHDAEFNDPEFENEYNIKMLNFTDKDYEKCCELFNSDIFDLGGIYGNCVDKVLGNEENLLTPEQIAEFNKGKKSYSPKTLTLDEELYEHENLINDIGQDEYLKALWYMEQNNLTISDILGTDGSLKTDMINDYYASHDLPTNDDFIQYFDILGDKISGLSEFIRNLNKSKDGKDRVYTSIKDRGKNM